ncbi:hydroxamate siderophore iron reductase FhuF [Salmonella enterica subsp. enterica serovar Choleraesuis]|nr:hydroxamate siderophore iron reductase FhuF [Salmonella enterica subsp. enterica serovar Choleraesuis]
MATAYSISSFIDTSSWLPIRRDDAGLDSALRERFAADRPYFNEIISLNEAPPHDSMTLFEWARPTNLTSLLASYSNHIYRDNPGMPIEHKPLKSLWAQWYVGLLVPPLIMAALTEKRALDLSLQRIHAGFHETGRAAHFWIEAREDRRATRLTPLQRLEAIWQNVVAPMIAILENSGDINGKLIWSNTGYLVNWFLGELQPQLGERQVSELREACFMNKNLSDGSANPLFRTMIIREGLRVRRTCCQRNRLPGVQQCGDCTLDK